MTARHGLALLLSVLLAALAATGTALAERRVALVIGNGSYQNTSQLRNPANDARALAAKLEDLKFEVLLGIDLDDQAFRRLARDFAVKSEGADAALFYYAGHGLQVNQRNFLLPVNAILKREIDLEYEAVPLDLIMSHMERGERVNIVLLDACRNNPLAEDLARSMGTRSVTVGRGLARVETGVGTYVGFSTQPGNVALDGEGDNSPFATALVERIGKPGLDIETLMRQVRENVISATQGKQVPWGNSSLVGRGFIFNPEVQQAAATVPAPAPERTVPQLALTDQANIEIAYWNSIKDSGSPEFFEAYLKEYPNGRFARLAEIMIDNLTSRSKPQPAIQEKKPEPPKEAAPTPPAPPQQVAAADARQQAPEAAKSDAAEEGFWLAAKEGSEPKLIEAYLKRYPKGAHVKEAKQILQTLRQREATLPQPVEEAKPEVPKAPAVEVKKPPATAKAKEPSRPKTENKPRKPVSASVSRPVKAQPKRESCGWCNFGRSQISFVCGRDFDRLRAVRRCR